MYHVKINRTDDFLSHCPTCDKESMSPTSERYGKDNRDFEASFECNECALTISHFYSYQFTTWEDKK